MRKETTKKNQDANSEYKEFRKKWAREHEEDFLNIIEKIGTEMGLRITPLQYVQAYKMCIETYRFGYPTEFKVAELIATPETYEQILAITTAVIKKFRLAFWKDRRKRELRKKAGRKGKVA